jgi:hypothetical protein
MGVIAAGRRRSPPVIDMDTNKLIGMIKAGDKP